MGDTRGFAPWAAAVKCVHIYSSSGHVQLASTWKAMVSKTVLVQLGSFNRVINDSSTGEEDEQEILIKLVREAYAECIGVNDSVTLQIKDEQWGEGVFADFFESTVPDRAVYKAIVESCEVSI